MAEKKNFILRVDPETFSILEKWASDEFRSVNGQIEYLLNSAIIHSGRRQLHTKKLAGNANTKIKKK
ncbi:MAG TPA: Arc family DNA binding domain-containing protein [Chitinophagaceae bacterium]|nr:Arc family DNA binding domain-containing protein [Chitinophagaceae bacterium]MCC6634824.1 Arc family DNA binding domain-containing protein [Chitinophagaceae bacterium]HMZ45794.1 Arc family DNA binding domain-containing protein [Chitinophagaceae bacterium]HNE93378.1 Arc family DNA binding domain-containing protein [Chitinophagaceae bacterium]HNF28947.1 Arc family DNA binding domain-containing protein [Chitinophagaceae bacterium]